MGIVKTRHYLIIGGIVVLLAALALVWSQQPQGLGGYQDLFVKQDYDGARTAITQELSKKPQWHEARALLAEVELAAGQPLAALRQIIILWQAEWETDDLEKSFLTVLPPTDGDAAIALLHSSSSTIRAAQLAVGIALKADSLDLFARTLPALAELQSNHPLIAQAWSQLKTKDPAAVWKIAGEINPAYKRELLHELHSRSELAGFLPQLLASDPQAHELLTNLARITGGREGLKLLAAMEEAGYNPDGDENFTKLKLDLLMMAAPEQADSSFFAGIEKSKLYALAKDWVGYSLWDDDAYPTETTASLLAYLSEDEQYREQSLLLKAILQPPPEPVPSSIFYYEQRRDGSSMVRWDVSPCGSHVLLLDQNTGITYWYSLAEQAYKKEFSSMLTAWHWDVDNKLVALIPSQAPGKILIYDAQTAQKLAQFAWTGASVLGWQDGCLLLAHAQGKGYAVEALDPVKGESRTLTTTPARPSLSATGKLGFLQHTDSNLTIVLGQEEIAFSGSWSTKHWLLHAWLPQDRGVILATQEELAILYFADGKFLPMGLAEFDLCPWGWLDQNRVVATVNCGFTSVLVMDIRDMSWTHAGINWAYNGRVSDTVISRFQDGNMLVFRLK